MEETSEKKPFRTVYTIIEKPGDKRYWMKIGIARVNHDQSWNIYLDALPFDRKLQIRDDNNRPRFDSHQDRPAPTQPSFDVGGIQ
jgi:hypothetical protein